jgi:hypothetical protein
MDECPTLQSIRIDVRNAVEKGGAVLITASVTVFPDAIHSAEFIVPQRNFESVWDYLWRDAGARLRESILAK